MKRDGRPQLSNITYLAGDDGIIRISITADRAKYVNLRRDPRATPARHAGRLLGLRRDRRRRRRGARRRRTRRRDGRGARRRCTAASRASIPTGTSTAPSWSSDRRTVVRLRPIHAYGMLPTEPAERSGRDRRHREIRARTAWTNPRLDQRWTPLKITATRSSSAIWSRIASRPASPARAGGADVDVGRARGELVRLARRAPRSTTTGEPPVPVIASITPSQS